MWLSWPNKYGNFYGMAKILRAVIGFLFDGRGNFLLIEKNHPAWQKGRLNGIGGKIERGETPLQAMIREFREEAGAAVTFWREFALVTGDGYKLYLYTAKENVKLNPTPDEGPINWYPVDNLPPNILLNMRFLIPMADYKFNITAKIIHPEPEC
jgi:8-oxo-dGTP diphosphatase